MTAPIHAIVLAAGQGTRMKSARPKVLHALGGRPMLGRVLDAVRAAGFAEAHVVLGHGADAVRAWLASEPPPTPQTVQQAQQLGTAHAVQQALPNVPDTDHVVVLYGDVPLIEPETLRALAAAAEVGLALVTAIVDVPTGYGRILRDDAGRITGIVEEKDATPAQRQICEINTGLIAAPARRLRRWLAHVGNDNANGEYYLTDVVALAAQDGVEVRAIAAADPARVEGVNDPQQLARAERTLQRQAADRLLRAGVQLADPARFDLRGRLQAGRDVQIDVGCVFEGEVELGDDVRVGPYCVLRNVTVAAGTRIDAHSMLDGSAVGAGCVIGPYARLRPGSRLGDGAHVGNFVELKQTTLGDGAKANHLAYLGDATIGARVNVGAGVITCNYDGANKFRTTIGDDAFIGTDSQLIAPVTIGERAYIAAGSTIARDAPADALTICRHREPRSIPGWKRPKKDA